MSIVRQSAREPTTQPTTHNPQPTTHNSQYQDEPPPPYPPAALPSLSMGRAVAPPNLGAMTPYGSTASARWQVPDCHGWFSCLGHQNATRQKLERGTGSRPLVAAIRMLNATTNQKLVSAVRGSS
jgi:hypothetical protein